MRRPREWARRAVLLCTLFCSCHSSQRECLEPTTPSVDSAPAKRIYLESYCQQYGLKSEHNQYYAFVTLKPGVDPGEFAAKVLEYLQGSDQLDTLWLSDAKDGPSPRQYWALILADHTQGSLELFSFESQQVRDDKVEALLARCRVADDAPREAVGSLSGELKKHIMWEYLDLTRMVRDHGPRTILESLLLLLDDKTRLSATTMIKLGEITFEGYCANVMTAALFAATLVVSGQFGVLPPLEEAREALRRALQARPLTATERTAAVERQLSSAASADLWAAFLTIIQSPVKIDPERCAGPGVERQGRILKFSGQRRISVACEESGAVFKMTRRR